MKKILILTSNNDISSTNVIKWLYYLDNSIPVIRLNTDELFENYTIKQEGINSPIFLKNRNIQFSTDQISVTWSWKWFQSNNLEKNEVIGLSDSVINRINRNIKKEKNVFFQHFINNLNHYKCKWLNKFMLDEINKLEQLEIADKIGLKIPRTFLKTRLNKQDFNSNLITKPISDGIGINIGKKYYKAYTSEVDKNMNNKNFLISLFQQGIQKEIELRVFFLDKKCHTVAILSQSDSQTSIDYRNYNHIYFNRLEHYVLPKEVSQKIELFMDHFNLQTGSLDFILDKQGNHIFLEVNPSGQYGVFKSCNIYPDKLIAEYLLKKHYEYH